MDAITLQIDALIAGGRGRGLHDGMQIFVPDVVPGERVRVRITKQHRGYAEAELVEVIEASAARVVPRCPVFGACGGCQWQHIDYAVQVEWKQRILAEQLTRLGGIKQPNVLPAIGAARPWHYRSRIQLQIDAQGRVGFYRRGSHEVVVFEECFIAAPEINAKLAAAREQLRREGKGRHVRIGEGAGFTQVNPEQNIRLQQLVRDGVRAHGGGSVVELYCGNGNLSFPLADVVTQLTGIDDHAGAIRTAQQRVAREQSPQLSFQCTAAQRFLTRAAAEQLPIDGLLLDPPRRGAPEAMAGIVQLRPHWIGYVSCDPATLARDVKALLAAGYRHESSQPIDMFPQTFHIESLTWLRRSE